MDLEGVSRWTICFLDPDVERRFVESRHQRLATGLSLCSAIVFLHLLFSLATLPYEWLTGGGIFEASEATVAMILARNLVVIGMALVCAACALAARSRYLQRRVSPVHLESFAAIWFGLTFLLTLVVYPWYWAKMLGHDPQAVVAVSYQHDADMLLKLDVLLTICHVALPLRLPWFWAAEVVALAAYCGLAFGLGGPLEAAASLRLGALAAFLAACLGAGRRSTEIFERALFQSAMLEKARQPASNQRLEVIQEESLELDRPPPVFLHKFPSFQSESSACAPVASTSSACAPAASTFTSMTDDLFEGIGCRGRSSSEEWLQSIADLGYKEHWLIPARDLQVCSGNILGAGGFGMVLSGSYHNVPVAVKTTRDPAPDCSAGFASIAQEVRTLRRLRHPNIVVFYGTCIVPVTQELLVVLEHVQGQHLGDIVGGIAPVALSISDRLKLAHDISLALRYLHSQRPCVVHGDIKDSNILVETLHVGLRAKLVDFGLSRVLKKNSQPLGGTTRWMAPEVIKGGHLPDVSSDVFSFGRLLFMVMTGRTPLADVFLEDIIKAAIAGREHRLDWRPACLSTKACKRVSDSCTQTASRSRPSMSQVQEIVSRILQEDFHGDCPARNDAALAQPIDDLHVAIENARASLCISEADRKTREGCASPPRLDGSSLAAQVDFSTATGDFSVFEELSPRQDAPKTPTKVSL